MSDSDALAGFTVKRLGLAVSGGADSSALAVLAAERRVSNEFYTCVVHCSHGSSFGETEDDVIAVRNLANRLSLPFFEIPLTIRRRRGESPEMAARRVRIDALRRFSLQHGLDAVATGHHADDVAETLLLRLVRGGGATGLSGLRPRSEYNGIVLVRPLLGFTHAELCDVLKRRGVVWREDPTNSDESILRNRIRRTVIPWLERNLDPALRHHLAQSADILRADDAALENAAEALFYRITDADGQLVSAPLKDAPLALRRRAARHFLRASGKPDGFRETEAFLAQATTKTSDESFPSDFSFVITPIRGIVPGTKGIGALPAVCSVSAAAIAGRTLQLRTRRNGDRIIPLGFPHARKLKDIFIDAKVPQIIRDTLPILADAQTGEVLWVPGYRIAGSVAVPDENALSYKLTLTYRPAQG